MTTLNFPPLPACVRLGSGCLHFTRLAQGARAPRAKGKVDAIAQQNLRVNGPRQINDPIRASPQKEEPHQAHAQDQKGDAVLTVLRGRVCLRALTGVR